MKKYLDGDLEVAAPSQAEPLFFDKRSEVDQHENRLPHWEQDGRTYFITVHLADSVPQPKLKEWSTDRATWLKYNPEPWSADQQREYRERFANTLERWLDAGEGSCAFRETGISKIVGEALQHLEGSRCQHHTWVIMPNHAHLLLSMDPGHTLFDLMRDWKGYTSRCINRSLNRSGVLWQKDYYDRLVRNPQHFWNCARCIRNNPQKARFSSGAYLLYESSFVQNGLNWEGRLPSRPLKGRSKIGDLEVAAPSQ